MVASSKTSVNGGSSKCRIEEGEPWDGRELTVVFQKAVCLLYPTRALGRVRPFKFQRYEGTRPRALQPFKSTVHSCIGLEL